MSFIETDPEFIKLFERFTNDDVAGNEQLCLEEPLRFTVVLAALIGCQGREAYSEILPEALSSGLSPAAVKEIVYQAADYVGYGRMLDFLKLTNECFKKTGIPLPLEEQATVTTENRLEKGVEIQAEIFGDKMREEWKKGIINRFLAENCFGDYYTRNGLPVSHRELITFCFLMAQGGCEPQLIAHAKGNMNIGNSRELLVKTVMQCLPYIGYPRSLNALSCIDKALENFENQI